MNHEQPVAGDPYLQGVGLDVTWDGDHARVITVPDFKLTDHSHGTVTASRLQDRITIVTFFFSSCGKICPHLVKNLSRVHDRLNDDERVQFLLFSLNPEHDKPDVLAAFAQKMGVAQKPDWAFLTGHREDIYRLARETFVADLQDGSRAEDRNFLHSENVYIVDGRRRLRAVFNGNNPADLDRMVQLVKRMM